MDCSDGIKGVPPSSLPYRTFLAHACSAQLFTLLCIINLSTLLKHGYLSDYSMQRSRKPLQAKTETNTVQALPKISDVAWVPLNGLTLTHFFHTTSSLE